MDLNLIEIGSAWLIKLDLATETSSVMLRATSLAPRVIRILVTKMMLVEDITCLIKLKTRTLQSVRETISGRHSPPCDQTTLLNATSQQLSPAAQWL